MSALLAGVCNCGKTIHLISVGFIVLSVVLDVLVIAVFEMGTQGLSIANLIGAIAVFGIALFTNKGFQQLMTPKKLA